MTFCFRPKMLTSKTVNIFSLKQNHRLIFSCLPTYIFYILQTLNTNMRKSTLLSILTVGLFIAVLFLANWGTTLSEDKQRIYQQNQSLSTQLTALEELKKDLQHEVDTLKVSYGQVNQEKDYLEKLLHKTKTKLANTQSDFNEFRTESENAIQSLKEAIKKLLNAKSVLEKTIQTTNDTNDLLLKEAGIDRTIFRQIMTSSENKEVVLEQLKNEFKVVQEKRAEAARARAATRLKVKSPAPKVVERKVMRATAFRSETKMRNDKLTVKAKKVRKIEISFDLKDVPDNQLGEQELYLVVKNGKQKLLVDDAKTVKVKIKGLIREIRVVETKKVNLEKDQRVRFRLEIADRLEEGYHKVAVYSKDGLLGETSFRID